MAAIVEDVDAPLAVARVGCPLVTVSSPKGGVGKTTIARGLVVRATDLGIRAVGIDFDPQLGLKKWADQRQITRKASPAFTEVRVIRGDLNDWREALKDAAADAEVVIADTPPSVEAHMTSIAGLLKTSTYVLIPTGYTSDDLGSVIPWLKEMSRLK